MSNRKATLFVFAKGELHFETLLLNLKFHFKSSLSRFKKTLLCFPETLVRSRGHCSEFCTHLSVFLLGGDNFWTRYYRFISRSKQTAKDRARCAFIQPVKANQAVNQGNLELG